MTDQERADLNAAAEKARGAPDGEHVDVVYGGITSCVKCGLCKPRSGWQKPCRGWSRVTLRGDQ